MINTNNKPSLINKDVSKAGHISLEEKALLTKLLQTEFDNEKSALRKHLISDLYEKVSKSLDINFVYEDIFQEQA
tara:strand:+ start:6115 stop:6339 length:225 start_codon:yes stop_codon:yes gene_type:complete